MFLDALTRAEFKQKYQQSLTKSELVKREDSGFSQSSVRIPTEPQTSEEARLRTFYGFLSIRDSSP